MKLDDIKKQLDENSRKIIDNMNKIHQNSGALEILKDFKGDNKRLFIITIIILTMWIVTAGFLFYTLSKRSIEPLCYDQSIEMSDIYIEE